jgi:hypothetical protein
MVSAQELAAAGFTEISPDCWRYAFGHEDTGMTWRIHVDYPARQAEVTRGPAVCRECDSSALDLLAQLGCLPSAATGTDRTLVSYSKNF